MRQFIDQEINPYVDEWEDAEIFPAHELFKKAGDLGLLGLSYPEEYGGAGADYWYNMALAEELARDQVRRDSHGHGRANRHGHAGRSISSARTS